MNSMVGRFIIYFFSSHIGLFIYFFVLFIFCLYFWSMFLIFGFVYLWFCLLFVRVSFFCVAVCFLCLCLLLKSDKGMDLGEAELRDRKAVISIHCIYILLKMRTY